MAIGKEEKETHKVMGKIEKGEEVVVREEVKGKGKERRWKKRGQR